MQEKVQIVSNVLGRYYKSSGEYLFRCPYCKHDKHKLSINIEKSVYKCWICDARGRNLFRIIKRFGSYNDLEAWKAVSDVREDLTDFANIFQDDDIDFHAPQVVEAPHSFKTLTGAPTTPSAIKALNYLYNRGIDALDILKWKIGYCTSGEYRNRIIIPSFDTLGNLNYFIARTFSDDYRRYMNPPASRDIIFNELYLDFEQEVTIVEGAFDAIKAHNSVPILGSTLRETSRLFREIVRNDTSVLLALDPDAQYKSNSIKSLLMKYGIETREIKYKDGDYDIGDMSKDEVSKLSQEAQFVRDSDKLLSAISTI